MCVRAAKRRLSQTPFWRHQTSAVERSAVLFKSRLMLGFLVAARNPAGLKAHNPPLTSPVAINPGIPKPPANIPVTILAHQVSLGRHYSRIPVNPYLNVAEVQLANVQRPTPAAAEFIRLGFQCT